MRTLVRRSRWGVVGLVLLGGCDGGVCVSDPVEYSFGQRVYCYEGWSKADCDNNEDNQVNGASWEFHPGQVCDDRGFVEGGNDWP